MIFRRFALLIFAAFCLAVPAEAQVVINEIHYHPVEEEAFKADGTPALDLTDDVHEFIELRNAGAEAVDLGGWKLADGVSYSFPAGTIIPAGGYKVIAKNVARLQTVYAIGGVLGPYSGKLSNDGETVVLQDAGGVTVDSVSYSASFPWAQGADSLGANSDFLGVQDFTAYQYKGRSLQRVSAAAPSNDPANWLASPLPAGPTPGAANAVTRTLPKPVVVALNVFHSDDESTVIRAGHTVRVNVTFSSLDALSAVELQWWVDNIETYGETVTTIPMQSIGNNQYTLQTLIPAQADRAVVRFRVRANRGDGAAEVISPRLDDPQLTPVSATVREGWHAYFVQPSRTPNGRADYDFFISSANISTLTTNATQDPKRVLAASPGYPRDDPMYGYYTSFPALFPQYNPANYPAATAPHWDGTVPAIFAKDGVVYDIQTRFHGSRYQRNLAKNSWKVIFPRSHRLDGVKQRLLITEKGNDNVLGYALFHAANLPSAYSQYINFFKNTDATGITRCEISDNDSLMIERFQTEAIARSPQSPPVFTGDGIVYKSTGLDGDEGPYGWANGVKMPAVNVWTVLDRYIWSFTIQNDSWRGETPFSSMVDALWAARGDAARITYPNTYSGDPINYVNLDGLRAYLDANWAKDNILTYMAIRNWCSPWDDKFHNFNVYLQGDGKWTMTPWDFDTEMQGTDVNTAAPTNSIFAGKQDDGNGTYSNNFRGPNWFKDSVLRAYDDTVGPNTNIDYRKRLFVLNNTLLKPANVQALATSIGIAVPDANWLTSRFNSVNSQVNLGAWYAPNKPVNTAPSSNASVLPGANLTTSAYSHTNPSPVAHVKTRWEIRAGDGTFDAPVYNVLSTTNLTTLPIPFELLTFGKSYAWRATFYDADDHPSDASAETTFLFGLAPVTSTLVAISAGAPWKYNQTAAFNYPSPAPAANSPTWWASTAYNDSAWPSGDPLLGGSTSAALPANVRTSLTVGRLTYYFRRTFNFPGSPTGATIRATRWIDDGCVVYINGVEVPELRRNISTGTPSYTTLAPVLVAVAAQEGPIAVPSSYFVPGTNTIAVEVHQNSSTSSDIVFALGLEADISQASGDVVINEVLADNVSAAPLAGGYPDYIELYNATASSVSLAGWSLTDDVLVPGKYTFPAGTVIPAGGYLTVICDSETSAPGLHTGFKLSAGGQTVALSQGSTLKDSVTFGPQAQDLSIGRVGTGVGAWALTTPSPGAVNAAKTLGANTTLKVNEWMANPLTGEDWFELYNPDANPVSLTGLYLSDTPSKPKITQVPALSFIGGKGFTRFEADGTAVGGNHANFKLAAGGENLLVTAANGTTVIDSVSFGAQAVNASGGRLPDGAAVTVAFPLTPTPGASNYLPAPVVINEALPNSTTPLVDMIELHNPTAASVSVGGWWLSDDRSTPQKFQIPAGTSIPAGGYLVFNENQFNTGANAFSLSSLGDEIVLSAVDGVGAFTGYRAQVSFGAAADGVSFGRIPTGNPAGSQPPEFWPLLTRTFGLSNAAPRIGPVIVNEVMYHPPDLTGAVDNVRDEFIELHNVSTSPQNIGGWKFRGDLDFTFPVGTVIRPGDYTVVVGFDPAADASSLAAFRSAYGLAPATPILGPFAPKLANSSQRIELAAPGTPVSGVTPYLLVDKVEYADATPWPSAADGFGPSLQRLSRVVIGNDPANWSAATATPGAVNSGQAAILDNDGDGMSNAWEDLHGFDKFDASDAALDADGDGQTNLEESIANTDPRNGTDRFKVDVERTAGGGQGFVVRFTAAPNRAYTILYKTSMSNAQWQKLVDIPAQPVARTVEQNDPTTDPQRFYRIVTPQQ